MADVLSLDELVALLDRFGMKVKVDLAEAAADGVSPVAVADRCAPVAAGEQPGYQPLVQGPWLSSDHQWMDGMRRGCLPGWWESQPGSLRAGLTWSGLPGMSAPMDPARSNCARMRASTVPAGVGRDARPPVGAGRRGGWRAWPGGLTGRELQVLERIAAGTTNQRIARELVVTLDTVKNTSATTWASSAPPTAPRPSPARELSLIR